MTPINHNRSKTGKIGSQTRLPWDNKPTSSTSHNVFHTTTTRARDRKPFMVRNTGVASNTTLEQVNDSGTSQNIMASGPTTHQVMEEAPRQIKRD